MEQRAAIQFCVELKKTVAETFEIWKARAVMMFIKNKSVWMAWTFKGGRESLQGDERDGRPTASRKEEAAEFTQKSLAEDRTLGC
jgi:hypothetical protein